MLPSNLLGYATTDLSYVENVSNEIDVQDINIENEESSETDNGIGNNVVTDVAKVLGMNIEKEETYSLVFGEELAKYNIVYKSTKSEAELNEEFKDLHEITSAELGESSVIEVTDNTDETDNSENSNEENVKNSETVTGNDIAVASMINEPVVETSIQMVDQSDALLSTNTADENYTGAIVTLSAEDRDLLERLVMGEAGGEGVEGAALVAQAIRDTMVYKGFTSVADVRKACSYSGSTSKEPNQNVKDAVSFIFDNGGIAVKHTVFYFYAHKRCTSSFHESQQFIIEHGGHRFFSNW